MVEPLSCIACPKLSICFFNTCSQFQIIEMLTKEEMLDVELKIEQILKSAHAQAHAQQADNSNTDSSSKDKKTSENEEGFEEEEKKQNNKQIMAGKLLVNPKGIMIFGGKLIESILITLKMI